MKKLFKYILILSIFIVGTCYSILNLGFFFDISKIEKNTDLLLCLGGGKGERINKTIEIYKKYSLSKPKILLTENNTKALKKKLNLLLSANIDREDITTVNFIHNTYSELKQARLLMIKNGYKSINIISDEPHSRRIKILLDNFIYDDNDNISYNIVGSNVKWWNKEYYYKNKRRAVYFVVNESFKIIHNLTYYNYLRYFNKDESKYNTENSIQEKEFITKINHFITYLLSL